MKIAGVADTHVALWYLFADPKLSVVAKAFIDDAGVAKEKIAISAISLVELIYLIEKNRLSASALERLNESLSNPEQVFIETAVTGAVAGCMRYVTRAEVPDMPDRVIAATAVHFEVPVISRDRRRRAAKLKTVW